MASLAWTMAALDAPVTVVGSQVEVVLIPRNLVGWEALVVRASKVLGLQPAPGSIWEARSIFSRIQSIFFGVPTAVGADLTEVVLVRLSGCLPCWFEWQWLAMVVMVELLQKSYHFDSGLRGLVWEVVTLKDWPFPELIQQVWL